MLGSAVYESLKDTYDMILTLREAKKAELLDKACGGVGKHRLIRFDAALMQRNTNYFETFLNEVGNVDYVINAIGITQLHAEQNPPLTFFVNRDLPNILSKTFGSHLIHIATDGVYNGKRGPS